jgi:phosphate transport system permease protein
VGTFLLTVLTAVVVVVLGVGAAIYLQEYAQDTRINRIIEVNIANLAGVPSIVYGILGLGIFVESFRLFGLALTPGLGQVLLAGALTLSLLVLPVVIITTREALRAVPDTLREGGFALGATRWEVIRSHILPSALPGALTGTILALSRAIGETAPLIVVGASIFLIGGRGAAFSPSALFERYAALPIAVYNFIQRPQDEFVAVASATIVVLLVVLLLLNSIAIILRNRFQGRR